MKDTNSIYKTLQILRGRLDYINDLHNINKISFAREEKIFSRDQSISNDNELLSFRDNIASYLSTGAEANSAVYQKLMVLRDKVHDFEVSHHLEDTIANEIQQELTLGCSRLMSCLDTGQRFYKDLSALINHFRVKLKGKGAASIPIVYLPNEIWSKVLYWLPPLDRQSFKLITKGASNILTSSETKTSGIWGKIFYNNRQTNKVLQQGVDLALIGRIYDIGNKQAEKPFLFLVTLPARTTPWQEQEASILPYIRGEMEWDWRSKASTFDFPEFTVEVSGVHNNGRDIPLPKTYLSQFADESTCILYYSRDYSLNVSISRYDASYGQGKLLYINLEDGEIVLLKCNMY